MQQRVKKLAGSERREAILAAAIPIFARLGRVGATTKVIAEAAGISEALLFKHFTTKDMLYAQLERHCVEAQAVGLTMLGGATPSTTTLVTGVAVLVRAVFPGIGPRDAHDDTKRLVTASMLDDGRFAAAFLDRHVRPWIAFFSECLAAAREAGDVENGSHAGKAELWFVHHLANTLHLVSLSGSEVVDYGMTREELVDSAVLFLLRGLGLTEAAIRRSHDPAKLDAIIAQRSQD